MVPFLNMTKQFAGNISQVSNQINSVVMGLAGAQRIFALMDEAARSRTTAMSRWSTSSENADGSLAECRRAHRPVGLETPPSGDGTVTYTRLQGDVRLYDVDFAYDAGQDRAARHHASTPSRARRSPLWAPPARARPPSPT